MSDIRFLQEKYIINANFSISDDFFQEQSKTVHTSK